MNDLLNYTNKNHKLISGLHNKNHMTSEVYVTITHLKITSYKLRLKTSQ